MSADPIPANDLFSYAPVFDRYALLASVAVAKRELYNAQVVTHHRATDLYEMIFGTTERPKMNEVAA